ncbi:DUF3225 domain-containing protein [Metalysinibacillus jejuensis]|uniref:DUF3225 domain-containing protein n=1 Tax=Metalysinibacillus jejuensis TaxID=914327 RepID=UPI000D395AA7|nr:DUF3225 domain-containing protein [Metalysinibacillus jejuensis]
MKKGFLALICVMAIVLAACSNKEQETKEEDGVGFELTGDTIEEAANVPADKKQEIIASFEEYINAFNDKDLTRYLATLSKNTKSFDYNEQEESVQLEFEQFDTTRTVDTVTIVKYKEKEAQVFANVGIARTEKASGQSVEVQGRQVTVLVPEDDTWKVSSIYFIADTAPHEQ